jgi:acyl-CoA synthetase (AMP-forming)/AMP-acid ligase II
VLTNSGAKAIVTSATSAATLALVSADLSGPLKCYHEGEARPAGAAPVEQFFRSTRAPATRVGRTSDDVSNIVYTSGTTGKPKGAVRDLASLNLLELSAILERLPVRDGERHWIAARLYHSAPQAMLMMMTSLGGTVGIQRRFDPAQTLRALSKHDMTSIFLVPTMIARMVDLPDALWRENPVQLRLLLSGAAPFVHALRRRAIERFGVRAVHDFYGATELGWVTSLNGIEMLLRPDSVGRPLAGQSIRIELEDGSEAPVGTVGMLRVRNEQLMAGYLDNPGATAETLRDGWMTVEDNAWVDADGYIYLAGRARDMIISGGVNVYPAEVESALASCEGVEDVAVIGVQDPVWGERVEAFVVLRAGVELARVQAEARVRLSGARRPRAWHLVDELPRNATGKVLKRVLRERVTEP